MVVKMKPIKPKAMKTDAFRLELLNGLRLFGTTAKGDYAKTTGTWKKKPKFYVKISLRGGNATVNVYTDNEIYPYLDDGTKGPYQIPKDPGKSKTLRFQEGYATKTSPGLIGSMRGGAYGNYVYRKQVTHPGIEARKFTEIIAKYREKDFQSIMQASLEKGAQKSGHAI